MARMLLQESSRFPSALLSRFLLWWKLAALRLVGGRRHLAVSYDWMQAYMHNYSPHKIKQRPLAILPRGNKKLMQVRARSPSEVRLVERIRKNGLRNKFPCIASPHDPMILPKHILSDLSEEKSPLGLIGSSDMEWNEEYGWRSPDLSRRRARILHSLYGVWFAICQSRTH